MRTRRHRRSRLVHVAVVVAAVLGGAATLAVPLTTPAAASIDPGAPPGVPGGGEPSELTVTRLAEGHSVVGYLGPVASVSDPAVAYPPSHGGFVFTPMDFAGLVDAEPPDGSPPSRSLYCTDIRTDTSIGYGYELGSWATAGTANAGYVARILSDFYPSTALPLDGTPGISDDGDRAAAVQAAIWYFTDNFVVADIDPLEPAVAAIVNAVRVQPPLPSPAAPSLTITPSDTTGVVGAVAGPFTVSTSAPDATVVATGAQMYADPSGTLPLPSPATVADGDTIYLRGSSVGDATLIATASLSVPTGSAYLYDGNIPGVDTAQNLILADEVTLDRTVDATARFQEPTTTSTVPSTTVPPTVPPTIAPPPTVAPTTVAPTTVPASGRGAGDGAVAGASIRPSALASTGSERSLLVAPAMLLMVAGVVLLGVRRSGPAALRGIRRGTRSGSRP